jgi:cystathionine beta-lyase
MVNTAMTDAAYDFTTPINRLGGDSIKWNKYVGRDILPLWVADMDFAAPPEVLAALQARIAHGVFGYAEATPGLTEAVQQRLLDHYGWAIQPDWLVWLPGLVTGLNVCCRAAGGEVITATPIYPPFLSAPHFSGQALHTVPLWGPGPDNDHWRFDWPAMQAAVTANTRLLLFCHPHNPVGRCWSPDELAAVADYCERNDLIVCSDEIHCDLVLDEGKRHVPLASLSPEIARRSITLMAPSKTFNVPGLACSFAVIPDAALRRRFTRAMNGIVPHVNALGLTACEAAFRQGEPWRQALLGILRQNRDALENAVARLPGISMSHVEATYLAWLDVRGLQLESPLAHFEAHGLGLSDGADFGAPGWLRFNFGCTAATLAEALARLKRAVS